MVKDIKKKRDGNTEGEKQPGCKKTSFWSFSRGDLRGAGETSAVMRNFRKFCCMMRGRIPPLFPKKPSVQSNFFPRLSGGQIYVSFWLC